MNFLLIFKQDWANEFNIPALACMTEYEFERWKEKKLGIINEKYEEQIQAYNIQVQKREEFVEQLKSKNLYNTPYNKYTDEEKEWYQKNKVDMVSFRNAPKKLKRCYVYASVGDSGEYFQDYLMNFTHCKDLLHANIVKLFVVDDEFKKVFDAARLSNLSLCNIFNFN